MVEKIQADFSEIDLNRVFIGDDPETQAPKQTIPSTAFFEDYVCTSLAVDSSIAFGPAHDLVEMHQQLREVLLPGDEAYSMRLPAPKHILGARQHKSRTFVLRRQNERLHDMTAFIALAPISIDDKLKCMKFYHRALKQHVDADRVADIIPRFIKSYMNSENYAALPIETQEDLVRLRKAYETTEPVKQSHRGQSLRSMLGRIASSR